MQTLSEQKLISIIKEEYTQRLSSVAGTLKLMEVKVFNDRGDLLLSKGLKVKHKTSGYEYTVDKVEGEGDDAIVFLRHPEVPRFAPPLDEPLMEQEDSEGPVTAMPSDEQIGLLRVSLKDFEKDYEVN